MGKGCSQIRPLLSAYLDEASGTEETCVVKEHLQSCADCREELSQLHCLCRILLHMEKPRAGRCLWESIKARL